MILSYDPWWESFLTVDMNEKVKKTDKKIDRKTNNKTNKTRSKFKNERGNCQFTTSIIAANEPLKKPKASALAPET